MPSSRKFRPAPSARRLHAWVPALLLAGCAATPPPPAAPAPSPEPLPVPAAARPDSPAATAASVETKAEAVAVAAPGQVPVLRPTEGNVALLAYADRLRTLAPNELAAEIARLADLSEPLRTPFHDMQLAIALGQTRSAQDLQRAQGLLQRLLGNGSEDARRLHPLARLVAARYTEQRRLEDQVERQNQQLRDSQRRIEQLNDRLEAVRAIERSLTRSGGNGGAAAAPPAPATAPKP